MRKLLVIAIISAVFLSSAGLHSATRIHADMGRSAIWAAISQIEQPYYRCQGSNAYSALGVCAAKLSAVPRAGARSGAATRIEYVTADFTIAAVNQPDFDPDPPKVLA